MAESSEQKTESTEERITRLEAELAMLKRVVFQSQPLNDWTQPPGWGSPPEGPQPANNVCLAEYGLRFFYRAAPANWPTYIGNSTASIAPLLIGWHPQHTAHLQKSWAVTVGCSLTGGLIPVDHTQIQHQPVAKAAESLGETDPAYLQQFAMPAGEVEELITELEKSPASPTWEPYDNWK